MKKILTLCALGVAALSATAQQTVQGAGLWDNWSAGVVAGATFPAKNGDFTDDLGLTYGAEISKQITPIWGMGLQLMAGHHVTNSANLFDAVTLSAMGRVNLHNLFLGYQGQPRDFEVDLTFGMGYGRNFYPNPKGDNGYILAKGGFNFNWNLGETKAWTVSVRPALVVSQEDLATNQTNLMKLGNAALELTAGVVYHFKNQNNGKNYMTLVRAYDQNEVDGLNAKINDLRAQVDNNKKAIAAKDEQVKQLQIQLNDCRNQKPAVQKETIVNNKKSLEQTITFGQGKSTVDASQLPNVERVATFLKHHPNATVSIKGYASPEGSAEVNARIAAARAEAVKGILINKYHISASRIKAEGQGVGNMFSENDWNRVSICTIEDAE